ncbi:MAG: hypothetical protein FWE83_02480 [Oscillospiraceae bacterium]|nr:hypothetical protein [Oscillospiraceae bacterium]
MPKYHIGKSGKPELCSATKRACPLGGDDTHIEAFSLEEVNQIFQQKMEQESKLGYISILRRCPKCGNRKLDD